MILENVPSLAAEISPIWSELEKGELDLIATARVPEELAVFADHFHGNPLVPGVVQLLWLQTLTEWAWPKRCLTSTLQRSRLCGHKRVKFKHPVLPGDVLQIKLTERQQAFSFTVDSGLGRCTDGQLIYALDDV